MPREIDWASAEVRDATLTVALTGEAPDEWSDYVSDVLDRLERRGGGWGEVSVGDEQIEVQSVTPGAEADLRHLLESAVLQANAHFAREEESEEDEDDAAESDEDRRMTDSFRSFGED